MVFIDGNNLYHRLKERGWITWISMGSLAQRIAGGRNLVWTYYYNAPPPGGKAHSNRGNKFLAEVEATPRLTVRRSRLQKTIETDSALGHQFETYLEKGADAALATDLVSLAASDAFDVAIIVSNDGDFEPPAREARDNYHKRIEVMYFDGSRPFVMDAVATMREFRRSYLREYDQERPKRR